MNARYQDGKIGRFLSQDPVFVVVGSPELKQKTGLELEQYLSDPQLHNSYSYVRNNPLKYKDPTGEFLFAPALVLAAPAIAALSSFLATNAHVIPALIDNYQTALNFAPGTGDIIAGKEAATGKDTFTGESLSPAERALAGLSVVPGVFGVMGEAGRKAIKAGDTVAGLRVTNHAAEGFINRNIDPKHVSTALEKGSRYLDTRTGNLLHVVGERAKGGYTVVTDYAQKTLVSVEDFVRNLEPKNSPGRFKKLD